MTKLFEDVQAALGNTELTESAVSALTNLVEKKLINQKVSMAEAHAQEIEKLTEDAKTTVKKAYEQANSRIEEAVDLAVEQVLTEYEDKLVTTDKFQKMQAVFSKLHEAFEESGFVVDGTGTVKKLTESIEQHSSDYEALFGKYTELKKRLQESKDELELSKRSIIFENMTRNLPETTKDKISRLAEAVQFDTLEEFKKGLALIVESQTGKKKGKSFDDEDELKEKRGKSKGKDSDEEEKLDEEDDEDELKEKRGKSKGKSFDDEDLDEAKGKDSDEEEKLDEEDDEDELKEKRGKAKGKDSDEKLQEARNRLKRKPLNEMSEKERMALYASSI